MAQYHAHVYFTSEQSDVAKSLFERIGAHEFPQLSAHKIFYARVGPHPLPMIEFHFDHKNKSQCIQWLSDHHKSLSTLIHLDTGNNLRDHTCDVVWLGVPLPIDFSFFELLKSRPELTVHPAQSGIIPAK